MGDIKFYVTGIEKRNTSAGFSEMTVRIVAENVGKSPAPYPKYGGDKLHLYVVLNGQMGSETYPYGSIELTGANINRLPPKFRYEYEAKFEVANIVSDFKLQFELWEHCGLCFDPIETTTLSFQSSDTFSVFDIPVDRDKRFSSLGESIEGCPNTTLSVSKVERVDFAWDEPTRVITGLVLHSNFVNMSGQAQRPNAGCGLSVTLITNDGEYYGGGGGWASETLFVPPGSSSNGLLVVIFSNFERLPIGSIENAYLVLRTTRATHSFLWGTKVEDDFEIIYEVPSISEMSYDEFSSYHIFSGVDIYPPP
jgi:hypothetical protein